VGLDRRHEVQRQPSGRSAGRKHRPELHRQLEQPRDRQRPRHVGRPARTSKPAQPAWIYFERATDPTKQDSTWAGRSTVPGDQTPASTRNGHREQQRRVQQPARRLRHSPAAVISKRPIEEKIQWGGHFISTVGYFSRQDPELINVLALHLPIRRAHLLNRGPWPPYPMNDRWTLRRAVVSPAGQLRRASGVGTKKKPAGICRPPYTWEGQGRCTGSAIYQKESNGFSTDRKPSVT